MPPAPRCRNATAARASSTWRPTNAVAAGARPATHSSYSARLSPSGREAQLALEVRAQPPVPADGRGPIAAAEGSPHELPVGLLVGGLDLDERLPAPGEAQQLGAASTNVLATRRGPLLVERAREQDAGTAGGRFGARRRVAGAERGLGESLEALDVRAQLVVREQGDVPAGQHDRVLTAEGMPAMVRGLAQVGRAGLGLEVRPQRVDDLLAQELVPLGERE